VGSPLDIVVDAHELHACAGLIDRQQHKTRAPISVLRAADTSGVDELNASNCALPGLMGVSEADDISGARTDILRHFFEE
jgi:hypothetical protein